MSRTFSIKNKKTFFGFRKVKIIQIGEIKSLMDNLIIDEMPNDPDKINQFLLASLDSVDSIGVGIDRKSSRTFEVSYDKNTSSYNVRVFTPSTTADWEIAIQFIQTLAQRLNNKIIDEEGVEYSSNNITYDYKRDILSGIYSLMDPQNENSTIFGIRHPFCLSKEQLDKIRALEDEDKITIFNSLIYENQYIDGYFAKQKFFQKDDEIIAVYLLRQEMPTILPYKAEVEFQNANIVSNEQINRWILKIFIFDNANYFGNYTELGELEYSVFIEKLPKDKYKHIDGKYILVDGLTQQELKNLLK